MRTASESIQKRGGVAQRKRSLGLKPLRES
jgi:hypothetical protein